MHSHEMLTTVVTAIAGGIFLIALSHRWKVPAIVPLLLGGIVLGPEVLGIVQPASLGEILPVFVSLAVGIILFEGGLTLDLEGYRSASKVIRRLLTVGVLTTWLVTAAAVTLVFGTSLPFGLLAASFVIVTGPTVIAPLLKRIKVTVKLHSILHWEGVLIDAIGVFIAILCFEYLLDKSIGNALSMFALRIAVGGGLGVAGGLGAYHLIRRRIIPGDLLNDFALAAAVFVFGVSELVVSESGLLAVTVAGLVLGAHKPADLKQLRQFKAEITDLLIGMLFILLAARLRFEQFADYGLRGLLMVLIVLFVVRPLNIAVSTFGLGLELRERLFLSWVAPRGIVAASMASLFTLHLQERGVPDAALVETFTYSIIIATVLLQGFTAGPLARRLGLSRPEPTGWLIVGAHRFGQQLAHFLSASAALPVVLVDSNPRAVAEARRNGLQAILADARDLELDERDEIQQVGNLLALTDNEELNVLLCHRWSSELGRGHVFRWGPAGGGMLDHHDVPGRQVWSRLPKPSLISAELERGEASLIEAGPGIGAPPPLATPVLAVQGGRVLLGHADLAAVDARPPALQLLLRREAEYVAQSLHPELVLQLDVDSQAELLAAMVDRARRILPELPRDEILEALLRRERIVPTALGHGVAVPHAYSARISERHVVVAQLRRGIELPTPDGEPVRLVFLLLSPPDDPEGHLATLADIARLTSDPTRREALKSAPDAQALLRLLAGPAGLSAAPGAQRAPAAT
jgi:NhaP-type Na+/H+ or K+/H+ antiporter/mannitol/fructose-specific phosphotransferase system IIA component (Ntr-type)